MRRGGCARDGLPARSEVLAGDERPLDLLWRPGVQSGEVEEEVVESPVPAGLEALTGAQSGLVGSCGSTATR